MSISEGPSLNQDRAFHGSEICYLKNPTDITREKAVIVVAGGIQNGASTGSIETLDLERIDQTGYLDEVTTYTYSGFQPSTSVTWQTASARIETTLASMATASLKMTTDSTEQLMYLFGGQKVYQKTETSCPAGAEFSLSDCTQTESQVSEPQSTVWRYNPFSDTLERVNVLPGNSPRAWSSMAVYSDVNGDHAYLIGGIDTGNGADTFDTPGIPSSTAVPTSVYCYGFAPLYDPYAPPSNESSDEYPTERKQFEFGNDMYGGKASIAGAGFNYYLCSKYTKSGYKFDCQSGVVVDLFNSRFEPFLTDIRAYHYVNPDNDDLMETKIVILGDTRVLFQERDKNVDIALTDFKERIAEAIEKKNMENAAEEEDKPEDKRKEPSFMNPNIFEYECSLFEKLRLPTEHKIGSFFGLYIILKWDAGFKAGWDVALGFEKSDEYLVAETDHDIDIYNRAYLKPSCYGSVYGFLSAGVSAGSVVTLGIDADFDIIRVDIEAMVAHNFGVNAAENPTLYGTLWSFDFIGTLSLVKGGVTAYVEFMLPGICSKKKWGIRWYYPCLERQRKTLPWPNVTFCAYAITLWDLHVPFTGHYSNWVQYDNTIDLNNDIDIRPGLNLLEPNQLIFNF